mgnify:CR=1 FL=1
MEVWKQAKIILLVKDQDKPHSHIDNHRPISILSNVYKTFERMLKGRIVNVMEESGPDHTGF